MKKLMLFYAILLIGCNQQADKPCSRQEVKDTVLSLFAKDARIFYNTGQGRIWDTVVSDSIIDIISNPVNQNSCGCEGTVYYRRLTKIWSNKQTKRMAIIIPEGEDKYAKGDLKGSGEMVAEEDSIRKYPDSVGTYFVKQSVKYEVKTTDDGKIEIEIIE